MNGLIQCPRGFLVETISFLHEGADSNSESMVLWLGTKQDRGWEVREVVRPDQEVDVDFFRIPPPSMRKLMSHIRATRLQILAQVHSHPGRAYHSKADDAWAIVRHVGAVSIVVPTFALGTNDQNFECRVATYRLNEDDRWAPIEFRNVVEVV